VRSGALRGGGGEKTDEKCGGGEAEHVVPLCGSAEPVYTPTLQASAKFAKAQLALPCEIVVGDEGAIVTQLADVDVLVSVGFTAAMAAAAPKLRLLQVPGAGLDRIEPPLNAIDPAG
jgi:hypothetical protein